MADVFDIDSGNRQDYHGQHSDMDNYSRQNQSSRWMPVENNQSSNQRSRRDFRVNINLNHQKSYDQLGRPDSPQMHNRNRSDSYRRSTSPRRMSDDRDGWHSPQRIQEQQPMYSQGYPQPPLPPTYSHEHYAQSYPPPAPGAYQGYGYGQQGGSFGQYIYPPAPPPPGYSGQEPPPAPPGTEYTSGWASAYPNQEHISKQQHPSTPDKDSFKKEAAIANEMKQQQATLIKQRDEYFRKASVLRRELEKLRVQKHELLSDKSPPRDSDGIMRENAKLQFEIQTKLKSIHNVVDMLSGIIGDEMKMKEDDISKNSTDSGSPKEHRSISIESEMRSKSDRGDGVYNYIHYDPELHWCRICDVFPRSAKDYLNHLHSPEHKHATQQHQLVDTPWHKLPADEELPSYKGAPIKRLPIKGLQFFISAPAWYCKLCDTWIGDLHCASIHLKSKNHGHNYSNFVEQNPHWEINWIKDREKAIERCGKMKLQEESELLTSELPFLPDKNKKHSHSSSKNKFDFHLESSSSKKKKKKSKKRQKRSSSRSSSSSSSSDSSSEEDDKSKSIRVAMRNKMRMQAQMILKEEMEGKLEALSKLVEEDRKQKEKQKLKEVDERQEKQKIDESSKVEDNIINQWMTVTNTNNDKQLLEGLKGRLKQRQELEKVKANQAAEQQRKQERLREEIKLKEIREREQREHREREREERERREKERFRRRDRSSSSSPDRRRHSRSRSRSSERYSKRNYRKNDRRHSPIPYKPKGDDEKNIYESHFEKQAAESAKKKATLNKKLPFIGRMPLLKKKKPENEQNDKQKAKGPNKNDDYEVRLTKFEPLGSVAALIPPPGVVHLPKIVMPPMPNQMIRVSADNPPPPPQIIPEPPKITEDDEDQDEAPPPPNITQPEIEEDDMQHAPPPAPDLDPKQKGGHLPRDFQDALNIIYPSNQPPEVAPDPNLMMQYQYFGYQGYPGMPMHYDYTVQDQLMSNEVNNPPKSMQIPEAPPPPSVHDDDLAMLGIDAGDMAAQTI